MEYDFYWAPDRAVVSDHPEPWEVALVIVLVKYRRSFPSFFSDPENKNPLVRWTAQGVKWSRSLRQPDGHAAGAG